jgi:hypothetical protein
VRALLTLLILILTLAASGLSSAVASIAMGEDDDCCVDGAEDKAPDPESGGERDRCPPFCHGCACSPSFAMPAPVAVVRVIRVALHRRAVHNDSQLPASPAGEGVFHPPRRAA